MTRFRASLISGRPWPALATSTQLDQSIQRFPHLSATVKSSALCQMTGGWPIMDRGSLAASASKMGRDSGTGIFVLMVRYFVSTRGTSTGTRS